MKFLRSLPSEWNTHVVVWRNKADLDIMSIDDLYNNFKIVEQEVKRTVTTSSSLGSQNMAFLSSHSSTNEVDTANIQVSTVSIIVSTISTHDNTANLSDATVYFQRTGKKITINRSDIAGYNKTKVECFNCHKMGHFARECRSPRNQESRQRNQDSSRKTVNVEDTSSKAMVAIDGSGFDWSYMTDDEAPTNMALMAFSDSEVHNSKTCSNTCLKSFKTLKTQYDNLRIEFNKSEFDLATYKRGLASVEEQLVFYTKNEMVQKPVLKIMEKGTGQREVRPVWNNTMRINHQNFFNSKRNFNPIAVLTKSRIVPISTAWQSSSRAAAPVSAARPINTATNKPLDDPQDALKDQGYVDSGCSRHMTGNISYLNDFKEHDEGYVAFERGAKGGKTTGKGIIRTGTNSNDFAGKGASFDTGQSSLDTGPSQDYILMPLWKDSSLFDSSSQDSNGHNKDNMVLLKKVNAIIKKGQMLKAVLKIPPVNTATPTYSNYLSDPLMPDLEDTGIFYDAYADRDKDAEADYNNLETALDDESWVEAMQEELFQFKLLNVWTLVDLPHGKRVIGTK
nr:ribonuclease H-like domain-containing protein [Tanacetum cinerariifolium]